MEIVEAVRRVALLKQLKPALTEQQELALIEKIAEMNWTSAELRRRADSVVMLDTFGTIAFQYWVHDLVGLRSEINEELARLARVDANRQVHFEQEVALAAEARIKQMLSEVVLTEADRLVAELRGADRAIQENKKTLAEIEERSRQQMKRRLKFARQSLVMLDGQARRLVMDEAVRRGYFETYDKGMLDHIHLFADRLYKIVEDAAFIRPASGEAA